MRKFLFLSLVALFAVSCSNDSIIEEKEDVENNFEIPSDVKFYATKADFEANVEDLQSSNAYNFENVWNNQIITKSGSNNITSYGYSNIQFGSSEKIMFGDFIKEYGLVPHTIYIQRKGTVIYRVNCSSTDGIIPRNYASLSEAMGWRPGVVVDNKYVKGFNVDSYVNGYIDLKTELYHIEADLSGRTYDVWQPFKPANLVWYYTLVDASWN